MTTLICDCETDNLLDKLTRLWTIQIGDADTDEVTVYADQPGFPPLSEAVERLKAADRVVFHNGFRFDLWAINKFFPGTIDPTKLFDTLVAARLMDPEEGSNSLEDWGRRLNVHKGSYTGDFQSFTPELVEYSRQDIVTGRALYKHVMAKLEGWGTSVETEMKFAYVMALQVRHGFLLNVPEAQELDATLRGELAEEKVALKGVFAPRWKATKTKPFTPKRDNKAAGYVAGCPLTQVALVEFNPASRREVGYRLKKLGWRPKKFGKDGTPTIDDDILMTLPWPEARRLQTYFTIAKKIEQISEGKSAWLKWVKPDNTVHGEVNTVGAATGRLGHSKPNMAQVNKKDRRMRKVWIARPGRRLVGCDGKGLQARVLSHYLARYDGGSYANKIVTGKEALKTDEHSSNLQALPYLNAAFDTTGDAYTKARDSAKTCLYCVLFGGQDPKLGRTLKEACRDAGLPMPPVTDKELGRQARLALFRAIIGFDKLAEAISAKVTKDGFLRGLDGRKVFIRSRHSALVFLMQAGEAAVMKLAQVIFHYEAAPAKGWEHGVDFDYVAQIHDEVQVETRPEIAEEVGKTFAECITEAGVRLGCRCPLAGSFSVGDDWSMTH
jgi:DNA polymerase-1